MFGGSRSGRQEQCAEHNAKSPMFGDKAVAVQLEKTHGRILTIVGRVGGVSASQDPSMRRIIPAGVSKLGQMVRIARRTVVAQPLDAFPEIVNNNVKYQPPL